MDLPFLHSSHNGLASFGNALRRTIGSAFRTLFTEILDPYVHRPIWGQRQVGGHSSQSESRAEFFGHKKAKPPQLTETAADCDGDVHDLLIGHMMRLRGITELTNIGC